MLDDLNELRPRMMSVAYRMLGSVVDAEDAVQEAYLGLQKADSVTSPEGYLLRATTRKCIDRLRAVKRRADYVGPWVPEPIDTTDSIHELRLGESLSQGFLLLLERLSPLERACFLLRSVFDYSYPEIAAVLGKSVVHVRQIVTRARSHLKENTNTRSVSREEAEKLAERFTRACRAGDMKLVEELMTEDVRVLSDGGGKVAAAGKIIEGRSLVARFLTKVFHVKRRNYEMSTVLVNGTPGVVFSLDGVVAQVASLEIDDGIRGIYMTLNPDKLSRWSSARVD